MNLQHIDLDQSCWAQSLFRRMKFVRRFNTTGKVPIPEALRKELENAYLHNIVKKIEENYIPVSLVLNLDQTPSKYIPVSNKTMAAKGCKTVPIKGSTDKRMITATFIITLDGQFLPMQLIYAGKTTKCLPRVKFPSSFSLSFNPKHYSNEEESIKVLNDIVIPYVVEERERLGSDKSHAALLIMDVFKGQMTDPVLKILSSNNILLQSVPANFTYLFQPLDVQGGPNGFVKRLMKKKFSDWYANQITNALDEGQELDSIDIELKLSIIKPLHAQWIMEMYNAMTSAEGKETCIKGWKVAGIKEAVELGVSKLPSLDPFEDIDPMLEEDSNISTIDSSMILQAATYIPNDLVVESDDDDEEWVDEQMDRNIFDLSFFDDETDL